MTRHQAGQVFHSSSSLMLTTPPDTEEELTYPKPHTVGEVVSGVKVRPESLVSLSPRKRSDPPLPISHQLQTGMCWMLCRVWGELPN